LLDNYLPLADAGVLQLVDDDQTIMPGREGAPHRRPTMHHQMIVDRIGGKTAAFVADLMPTSVPLPEPWMMGFDLYPHGHARREERFAREAREKGTLSSSNTIRHRGGYIREDRRQTRLGS
jgi:hypothetical protein